MKKLYWFLIFIIALVVFTFITYYNVIKIGVVLGEKNIYIEHGFYGICAILYIALILDPMLRILFAPVYSVGRITSGEREDYSFCLKLTKNILKKDILKESEKEELRILLKSKGKDKHERVNKKLFLVYNNSIKKSIDDYINETAKSTFYLTALSQKGFLDMLIVVINNFKMIKKLVWMCGFRPSFIRVLKLYVNIFFSSLIADGAQNINLTSLLGASLSSGLKVSVNSVANGTINAFFMLRTGILAKQYLYSEEAKKKKIELRKTAMAEAAVLLPSIITSVITDPIKGLTKIFKGNTNDEGEEEDIIVDLNQKWYKKK